MQLDIKKETLEKYDETSFLKDVFMNKEKYSDLVSAAVRGFTNGFLSTFNVTDTMRAAPIEYDIEAYNYLTGTK